MGSFVSVDHFMDQFNTNYVKAAASQWGLITFNHHIPRNSWYSLDWPLTDESLRQFFSHPMVLNLGSGKPCPNHIALSFISYVTSTSILPCWNWAILQIYFCTLNMKHTSSILLEIFWLSKFATLWKQLKRYRFVSFNYTLIESIKKLVMKCTSGIPWTCFRNAFVFLFWVRKYT